MKKQILLFLAMTILALQACKKDEEPEPKPDPDPIPDEEIIVSEETKVVRPEVRNAILSIDTVNFSFTFSAGNGFVDSLKTGDILVDSTSALAPYGYLRKITSINRKKDGETMVTTEQAALTEAVNKGSLSFITSKLSIADVQSYTLSEGVEMKSLKNTDFTVFAFDYEKVFENENGKVTISGYTELDIEFFFDFEWDFEWLAIPPHPVVEKFESGVAINQIASIMCVSEAGAAVQERIPLAEFYFTPWTFSVGPVPVVFLPKVELFIEMDGSITAEFSASASESFYGRLGTQYTDDNGWKEIAQKEYEKDYVAPNMDAGANFTTHIGPEINLLLYGIAGPFANVSAFSKTDAFLHSSSGNWDLEFKVGVQTKVGVKIEMLGFNQNWDKSFILFEEVLMHLDDEPFGNHIYISHPVDGQSWLVGDDLNITTTFTGEMPEEVEFYIDYTHVHTDTEAPFEFIWDTEGQPEGSHPIGVNYIKNGEQLSTDAAFVYLKVAEWELQNLHDLGLDETTDANDLFFINTSKGYMTVSGPGTGKLIITEDGGLSWQETYAFTNPLKKVLMFNDQGEGIFLDAHGKVLHSTDDGHSMSELVYGQFDQPTFQWKEIFDFTTNNNGEIVAVGKDEGIPYHYRIYRAETAFHEPTGYFEIPYPNEYGTAPGIVMNGNKGFLFDVYNEDEPSLSYYMITEDGGVSWEGHKFQVISSSVNLYDAYMPDEDHIWIVGEQNGSAVVVMSDNGGESWNSVFLTSIPAFSSVFFTSDTEGYASVKDWSDEFEPKLYRTIDGGHNWEPIIDTRNKYGMSKVFFVGQDFGLLSGKGPSIFRFSMD